MCTAQLDPSGDSFININTYKGRYTYLQNVRYEVSGLNYTTEQQQSITQITGDIKVPPTAVYQVKSTADLLLALNHSSVIFQPSGSYRQYVVFNSNITLSEIEGVDQDRLPELPLDVRSPTTITGWPQAYSVMDCHLLTGWFLLAAEVTLKNLIFLNLGRPIGMLDQPGSTLSSGLWLFYPSSSW